MLKVDFYDELQKCSSCGHLLWAFGERNFSLNPHLPHFNNDGTIRMKVTVVCNNCGNILAEQWLITEGE